MTLENGTGSWVGPHLVYAHQEDAWPFYTQTRYKPAAIWMSFGWELGIEPSNLFWESFYLIHSWSFSLTNRSGHSLLWKSRASWVVRALAVGRLELCWIIRSTFESLELIFPYISVNTQRCLRNFTKAPCWFWFLGKKLNCFDAQAVHTSKEAAEQYCPIEGDQV